MDDKRKFIRARFRVEVSSIAGTGIKIAGGTRDISRGGVYIECEKKLQPGTKCRVSVELEGTIVRSDDGGMAVEFVEAVEND